MGETTGISWTDRTYNPWYGCKEISPGCDHCYAHRDMARYGRPWVVTKAAPSTTHAPLKWEQEAIREGRQIKVFTCSWSDFVIREADPWRAEAWEIMRATPHLTYQVLTKRPGLLIAWARTHGWLPNVWAGVSVESQKYAPRLDVLGRLRAIDPNVILFASCEPLLDELDLLKWLEHHPSAAYLAGKVTPDMPAWTRIGVRVVDWVIAGGESGPKARPMNPAWARSLRDQCAVAGVPFFFKQWGEYAPYGAAGQGEVQPIRVLCEGGPKYLARVGTKAAGDILDGRRWHEFPQEERT